MSTGERTRLGLWRPQAGDSVVPCLGYRRRVSAAAGLERASLRRMATCARFAAAATVIAPWS